MKFKCKFCSRSFTFLKNVQKHENNSHKKLLVLQKEYPDAKIFMRSNITIIQYDKKSILQNSI